MDRSTYFNWYFTLFCIEKERRIEKMNRKGNSKILWIGALIILLLGGALFLLGNLGGGENAHEDVYIEHVHGLGYSPDGKQILIPSHHGIAMYENGAWRMQEGDKHDYMGYSIVDNGFYSSGHPEKGTGYKNPFGLIKGTLEKEKIETLSLYGEVDFHVMSASYTTHTVYVLNEAPNSEMKERGIYFTKDDGGTWSKSKMNGLEEEVLSLAVHPTNDAILAVGTPTGLYLSNNYGDTFEKVISDAQITAINFDQVGSLYVGGYDSQPWLIEMEVEKGSKKDITIPSMTEDAVSYVAKNPTADDIVITTYKKDVYISSDKGEKWNKIADQGKVLNKN
jgi:phosphoribosyl-AMP cyclohydrolase